MTHSERETNGWHPIETAPYRDLVDLWCIYGDEAVASYAAGTVIGKVVHNRHKSEEYGWFGNQSNDGVPNGHAPDLVPVAWRTPIPDCPIEFIESALAKARGKS